MSYFIIYSNNYFQFIYCHPTQVLRENETSSDINQDQTENEVKIEKDKKTINIENKIRTRLTDNVHNNSCLSLSQVDIRPHADSSPEKNIKNEDVRTGIVSTPSTKQNEDKNRSEIENDGELQNERNIIDDFSNLQVDTIVEDSMENIPCMGDLLSPHTSSPVTVPTYVKLSPLEIMRTAIRSVGVHNWSLFA